MGETFKDFPCLYFALSRVEHKEQVSHFSMLAAMFGLTPEQAAKTSEMFAHISRTLYGGVGISLDEINTIGADCYAKPYKDCRNFYRKKVWKENNLKDRCCAICPYSHNYSNAMLDTERRVLRNIIDQPERIRRNIFLGSDKFYSYLAISCSNDLSKNPIIPFHSYLYDYIVSGDEVTVEGVTKYISEILARNDQSYEEEALNRFVKTQLDIINRQDFYNDNSPEFRKDLRTLEMGYDYTSPQLTFPTSVPRSASTKRNKKLSDDANKIMLFDLDELTGAPDSIRSETSDDASHYSGTVDDLLVDDILSLCGSDMPIKEEAAPVVSVERKEAESEPCLSDPPPKEDALPKDAPTEEPVSEDATTDDVVTVTADSEGKINPSDPSRLPDVNSPLPVDYGEDDADLDLADIAPSFLECDDDGFPDEDEEESEPSAGEEVSRKSGESQVAISNYCSCCRSEVCVDDYPSEEEWKCRLIKHCFRCSNTALTKGAARQWESQSFKSHLSAAKSGCALSECPNEYACAFAEKPFSISDAFWTRIEDCSDIESGMSSSLNFIRFCSAAKDVSVEYVRYANAHGLLFYVDGGFFFVDESSKFGDYIRPFFSDAKKLSFYSLNPIPVHACLKRWGVTHARIESVSVLYSIYAGVDVICPMSMYLRIDRSLEVLPCILPQYPSVYKRFMLEDASDEKRYVRAKKLESALASSVDLSRIILNGVQSVVGGNAFNYKFLPKDISTIVRDGTLFLVSLSADSKLDHKETKDFWEEVAERIGASPLSFMDYTFLLGLGDGICYYSCFEAESFFDNLMRSIRSAYRSRYKKEVNVSVIKESYA